MGFGKDFEVRFGEFVAFVAFKALVGLIAFIRFGGFEIRVDVVFWCGRAVVVGD